MPTYEYECTNESCSSNCRIEKWKSIHDPHDLECPFCGDSMVKIYSSVGIHFKSNGFYSTDYK